MLISAKLEKLASYLKMNITKMRKTLQSKKFMIIFAKIGCKMQKLSQIFQIRMFSYFSNNHPQVGH